MKKSRQMEFVWPDGHGGSKWGGSRKGAGRKRQGPRARVSHDGREEFSQRRVLHVTCRIKEGLPSLRRAETVRLLMELLAQLCEREGFRIVEFSIQSNHIHLLCEADDKASLSSAMNGILSRIAKMLNRHWGRKGRVFEDRYHSEAVTSPTQCRHALNYILHNGKKHGALPLGPGTDPCSTAPWFPFASHPERRRDAKPAAPPQSWLLREGWRRAGSLSLAGHPRLPRRRTRPCHTP